MSDIPDDVAKAAYDYQIRQAILTERQRCADIAAHTSSCFWGGDGAVAADDIYAKIVSGEPAYTGEETP